ncbi:MAG: hypothetical protein JXJ18_05975 [Rhodobacteraceae bacterium]|nr:hypothetical protein [Paracoccaceae bacterium]
MARADLPPGDGLDTAAVIRSFSELAPHLRRHLGPALAERFLAAGDLSTATGIRNAIARSGDATRSEELTLVEARLDLSHGEDAVADARIDDVLSQGGRATPDALVLRLETELATGQPPAPDDIGLAEALAFERRGTALGARLLSLAIRGHGALGDFATAFRLLAHHGLEGQQDLASALVLGLARDGADADMLYQAYAGALTHPDLAASPEAWLAVADRMTRLGFAQRAEEILAGIAPQGSTEERLVRARLALAGNRPGQAQQYLGGLDGSQADVLRGEAAQRQGDLKAAADYFGAAGQTGRQSALSWRARDWDAVQAVGGEARVALAAERAQARTAELPQEPSLAAARAVLADSARMRDRLRGVLGAAVPQP